MTLQYQQKFKTSYMTIQYEPQSQSLSYNNVAVDDMTIQHQPELQTLYDNTVPDTITIFI